MAVASKLATIYPRACHSPDLILGLLQVKAFTATAMATQPRAPITGTTLAERLGLVRVLVDRPSAVMGRVTSVILDGPTPVPQALYEARRCASL